MGLGRSHSVFVARMPVKRKTGYYLTNIIPIYFIIVVYGWLAFGNLSEEDNQDQLNFLASLLLTMVSFKFTYRETLPQSPLFDADGLVRLCFCRHARAAGGHPRLGEALDAFAEAPRELYGLVMLVCLWFLIRGGIIIYAYWFFSYLTELGPSELKEYINRFRKSDQGIENQNDQNYRTHIGGRSESLLVVSCPNRT